MKIAVVGTGSIGKRHIGNLLAKGIEPGDIVAMDTREDRRAEVAGRFGLTEVLGGFEAVVERPLDAAILCSPTAVHITQAVPLARKGVHLMIEKPLDAGLDGVDALVEAVDDRGVRVLVAYCLRFSEHARKLKQAIDDRVVGRPLYLRGEFSEYLPDWHPWEDYRGFYMAHVAGGGGSLLDQSHVTDLAHWMFGEVEGVFAFNGRVSDLEVETDDLAEMQVRFRSGLIGTLHQDMFGRKHTKQIEVKCTGGNVLWDMYGLSVSVFDRAAGTETVHSFGKDHQVMYRTELDHFLDLCRGRETVSACSLADGIHGLRIIEAARRSAASGRLEAVG